MTYSDLRSACGAYKKNDVAALTPGQVVARLYEALTQDLCMAKRACEDGERALMGEKVSHALAIIGELQAGLDFEAGGEISVNLNSLYNYMVSEISRANCANDPGGFDRTLETVTPLADAWHQLAAPRKEKVASDMGSRPLEPTAVAAFRATF